MFFLCCFAKKTNIISKQSPILPHNIAFTTINNENIISQLQNIDYKSANSFYHNITYCKCIKVYDGDTITIASIINNTIYKFPVRLMGIDAPEIKGETINEKNKAIISRNELRNKILNKIIRIQVIQEHEKWGRILARVYLDDEDICQWLLDNNLAIPYSGKTKIKPIEWI
jgi:endonuclease YncB( thermonuclease family)